jgi:hypothetical protein
MPARALFAVAMARLTKELEAQFEESGKLEKQIRESLKGFRQ